VVILVSYWFGVGNCIHWLLLLMMRAASQCMHDGFQDRGFLGVLSVFLFYFRPAFWLDMVGFEDHIAFVFSYVWLGVRRDIEDYRETLACIFVFEIGRHMVGLCTNSTAGIAANAQFTFFVC
jgi:hypothetical protein